MQYPPFEIEIRVIEDEMYGSDYHYSICIGENQAGMSALVECRVYVGGVEGLQIGQIVLLQLVVEHGTSLWPESGHDTEVGLVTTHIDAWCDVHIYLFHLRYFRFHPGFTNLNGTL